MKTAYVVLSHQHPEQVLRLVRTLRTGSPSCTVVLHHDDRRVRVDEAALSALGGVERVLPPTPVAWGWTSQLDMLLRCLARALERGVRRFVLLSASSLPEDGPLMGAVHGWLHRHAHEWTVLRCFPA